MIKKSEINSLIIAEKVSKLEEKIDEELMSRYKKEGDKVVIDLKTEQPKEVLEKIKEIYEEAGWKITFGKYDASSYGTRWANECDRIEIS